MTREKHPLSTMDRLARSKTVRVAAGLLALALTGCATSSVGSSPGSGRASAVAVGTRSPESAPAPSSPATTPAAKTGVMPLSEMCAADNKTIDTAFQFGTYVNPADHCTVPATPTTPGDPVLRWDIGQFSIVIDKIGGLHGQLMKNYENAKGVKTFNVGGDEGIVEPGVARIDVQLADGSIAQMECQGPAVSPERTVPAMIDAASILLNLNGINPYSTPLGG